MAEVRGRQAGASLTRALRICGAQSLGSQDRSRARLGASAREQAKSPHHSARRRTKSRSDSEFHLGQPNALVRMRHSLAARGFRAHSPPDSGAQGLGARQLHVAGPLGFGLKRRPGLCRPVHRRPRNGRNAGPLTMTIGPAGTMAI